MIFGVTYNSHAAAVPFHYLAFGYSFDGIVSAFCMNIGPYSFYQCLDGRLIEYRYRIYGTNRRQYLCPFFLGA